MAPGLFKRSHRRRCQSHWHLSLIEKSGWNVTATARYLGIPLSTLKFKMDRLDIRELAKKLRGA